MRRGPARDLRNMLWASIDNDDFLDLDQLTVAQALPGDRVKLWVAIADVDSLVKEGSAIDAHASHNTTSVYTAAPRLPHAPREALHRSHFPEIQRRTASPWWSKCIVDEDGALQDTAIYPARVRNHAKLAYRSVAAWLNGSGVIPEAIAAVRGLDENLRLQERAAERLKSFRHVHGALSLRNHRSPPRLRWRSNPRPRSRREK